MALKNLNALHYSSEEKVVVLNSIATMEEVLVPKFMNLTPEERTKYGSVHEKNKLLINKVNTYNTNQPELSSPDIDWNEFQKDIASREFLESNITRLESITQSLRNLKIIHDYDCYQTALTEYQYNKYKLNSNANGFEIKA